MFIGIHKLEMKNLEFFLSILVKKKKKKKFKSILNLLKSSIKTANELGRGLFIWIPNKIKLNIE